MGQIPISSQELNHYDQYLQNAFLNIDSLKLFYENSIKSIKERRISIGKERKYALLLAEAFNDIFAEEDETKREEILSNVCEVKVNDEHRISDYIHIEILNDNGKTSISYTLLVEKSKRMHFDPKGVANECKKLKMSEKILSSSVLSSAVVIFETFLTEVYRALVYKNPLRYLGGNTIEVAKLFDNEIKDIIDDFVNREVEDKMYDSIATLELISKKEDISFDKYRKCFDSFKEVYYRRNVYIHNDGNANNKYLCGVPKNIINGVKDGDSLICDEPYIHNMFDVISKIIVSIYLEIIKKHEENEEAISNLGNYAFDFLFGENYTVAEHIYYELSNLKSLDFRDRLIYRIDYIIAAKQQGKNGLVEQELSALDVSAATEDFKIAKLCLEEHFEDVYRKLSETYPTSYEAEHIRDWPIFLEFRKTDFYSAFVKEHKEDFNKCIYLNDSEESKANELKCDTNKE